MNTFIVFSLNTKGGDNMQAIITETQRATLLREQGYLKLNRRGLAKKLGLSYGTIKTVLDAPTPLIVSGKTFTAVNNFLIDQLAKQ